MEAQAKAQMSPSPVLEARNLHKAFYTPTPLSILSGISLTVRQSETVAIMGRSGEGKTTLLHILGALEPACSGELFINGELVCRHNQSSIRRNHLGFIFQSFHLLEDYTVLENVLMPAYIARKSTVRGSPAYQRALSLLARVGMSHRRDFYTKLLSGGEKQRVALARAFSNKPTLLLADEPTGNLDKRNSAAVQEMLVEIAREESTGVVVVTHDPDLSDRCQHQYQMQDQQLISR